jgi:hypothetical protein
MSKPLDLDRLMRLGLTATEAPQLDSSATCFTVRRDVIMHSKFTKAVREIARIHRRGVEARVAEGLLLVAQTGSGKTTVLNYYERQFSRRLREGVWRIPVLRVSTPESPTVKSLAESILDAMGDVAAGKGNATDKTRRIVHFCERCEVELLALDEFQHFFDGKRLAESQRVSDWLKLLIETLKVPVVLAGLPRAMQVVNNNPQLRRRFAAPHYMEPFEFGTVDERKEFRAVLKGLSVGLPEGSVDLSQVELAQRFYYATHGLIDYAVKLVDDAVSRGGSGSGGSVMQEDFEKAFVRSIWSSAPKMLNPFHPTAHLRVLDRPGEPFDIWDDPAKYTGGQARLRSRKK